MKKLAIFPAFGAVLAVGLPGQAKAVDFATVVCNNGFTDSQSVIRSQVNAGVTLPASCAPTSSNCSQCVATLLSNGFQLVNPAEVFVPNGGPYLFFKRGGN